MIKGCPAIRLHVQRRLPNQLAIVPRRQFYDGMANIELANIDNNYKTAVRKVSKDHYGIEGAHREASEHFMVNIAHGLWRREHNGNSSINVANATAVLDTLAYLLKHTDVHVQHIVILVYYAVQRRLLRERINDVEWSKETKQGIEVFTVDGLKGRDAEIIPLDMVGAYDQLAIDPKGNQPRDSGGEDVQDNDKDKQIIRPGGRKLFTAFVSPKRLCIAITRAKSALIMFCQRRSMTDSRKGKRKTFSSITNLMAVSQARGLIYRDTFHEYIHTTQNFEAKRQSTFEGEKQSTRLASNGIRDTSLSDFDSTRDLNTG